MIVITSKTNTQRRKQCHPYFSNDYPDKTDPQLFIHCHFFSHVY